MSDHVHLSQDFIDTIHDKANIATIIGDVVKLKKTGKHLKGLCPFHAEKTPSFVVNPDAQMYHCHGCGAGGDVVKFVTDYYHLSFFDAIAQLAQSTGMAMPTSDKQHVNDESKQLYATNESVAKQYSANLSGHQEKDICINYLKKRRISKATAEFFHLGYAASEWRSIQGSRQHLLDLGLIREKNGRDYDFFRNRLIFPIRNQKGQFIGFGGRIFDEGTPKYLNSSESRVFKKNETVYGLYEVLQSDRNPDFLLITEGYMDVISLYQNGFKKAVATLGTATTEQHIKTLFRYTDHLVFCFDGDSAGQKAAWKAIQSVMPFVSGEKRVSIVLLPDNLDPDEFVKAKGVNALLAMITAAKPLSSFFYDYLKSIHSLDTLEGKTRFFDDAKPLLDKLQSGAFKMLMQNQLQEVTGLAGKWKSAGKQSAPKEEAAPLPSAVSELTAIDFIAFILYHAPDIVQHIPAPFLKSLGNGIDGTVLKALFLHIHNKKPVAEFAQSLENADMSTHFIAILSSHFILPEQPKIPPCLDELMKKVDRQIRKTKLDGLVDKSKKQELSHDEKIELLCLLSQQG